MSKAFYRAVEAVIEGRVDELRGLLAQSPTLINDHSDPPFSATLLHYVAANGVEDSLQKSPPNAVDVAELLLEAGAEADALAQGYGGGVNQTPLCLLVSSWHPSAAGVQEDLVRCLIRFGAKSDGLSDDGMPLATALVFGYSRAAQALAECGARVDNLFFASGLGDLDKARSFFDSSLELSKEALGTYRSPFLLEGSQEPAKILQEALMFAVSHDRVAVGQFLLDRGAKVNGETDGHHCRTPLAQACFLGRENAAKMLLAHGADLHAIDGKRKASALELSSDSLRRLLSPHLVIESPPRKERRPPKKEPPRDDS